MISNKINESFRTNFIFRFWHRFDDILEVDFGNDVLFFFFMAARKFFLDFGASHLVSHRINNGFMGLSSGEFGGHFNAGN